MSETDLNYMRMAVRLAEGGGGWVNPNPLVGAVIVKDGRVIGQGFHERFGGPHAERNALANCSENPEGSTLYVSLEPCCHHGKTPPCTDAIIASGISRVVVGMPDPNPLVSGKGLELIRSAGISVESGLLEDEIREQNRFFIKYISQKKPWTALKSAMTLDGKIASKTKDSKWISCEESREYVHGLRSRFAAVAVGSSTAIADDPLLNCRLENGDVHQPLRIVIDSRAKLPCASRIAQTALEFPAMVACTDEAPSGRIKDLERTGIEVLVCASKDGRVDLDDLLQKLGSKGIDSLLVEGGGNLNYSFLNQGLADELYLFVAPKILGGASAVTPVEGEGFGNVADAISVEYQEIIQMGTDILIRAKCLRD